VRFPRASGILLHPTSLPGEYGIGNLGEPAYDFVDFLSASGQRLWQVLPLGPTGYGDSPYQSFSAFAGNHLLISLAELLREGVLAPSDLDTAPQTSDNRVDYGSVIDFKRAVLRESFARFKAQASRAQRGEFSEFQAVHQSWLDDYALFMALKDHFGGVAWNRWDRAIRMREPDAVADWTHGLVNDIEFHKYLQFQFFRQWLALRRYANRRAIRIVGDIPIFVAFDSADAWANRELFFFDAEGNPTVVAGVPPDYFTETGQLWGNPLYRWDAMVANGYAWWTHRFAATFKQVDIVRVDHFRGFEAYWEVPGDAETAVNGEWVKGPGAELFRAVERELGALPVIAEDLGVITPEVEALRGELGFPGMKILQFAFNGDNGSDYLPHNYDRNYAVYTGTHDNDTTCGWFESAPEGERQFALAYTGSDGQEFHWDLIRLALSSVADMAIIPLQDVLGLGTDARMNFPGRPSGNWTWRYAPGMLTPEMITRLRTLTWIYGRTPAKAGVPE
jgi:4-alpha-glucanotransferase